ncbi:MAG: hypothetical protein NDI69_13895 [Bacteriovoracaceae bacterium]|nr:hypothetical protein [Bacteriovoracaceae bacterium]
MKKLFILVLVCTEAFALDAVVTVLETPLFKHRSYEAPVVQYLRKGDVIKIHPSVGNDRKFDEHAPAPEKLQALQKKMKESPEYKQDPLFRGETENTYYIEDEFIPTLDRQGNTGYVLSEHIYVYFGDSREFSQNINKVDPTDYRLEEPLPKNYPLKNPTGYRGQFLVGLTQPYYESYPYQDSFKKKGYTSPLDLNFTLLRQAPGNYHDRLFIGGTMNFRSFENTYTFYDRRYSKEEGLKFGIGPTISYDAFKGEKNRVNLSATILINLFDQLKVTQSLDEETESRTYNAYSIAPRLSLQYHRKQVFPDIDFVVGTALEVGTAATYRAQDAGSEASWWQHLGNDKFTTRTTFTLGGYLGIQSAY